MLCQSTQGVCSGKTVASIYQIAGDGNATDGIDDQLLLTPIGKPVEISVDSQDNILVGDNTFGRIRLICQSATGLCSGKTAGRLFRFAGDGTVNDSVNDSPVTGAIGKPSHFAFTTDGALYILDVQTRRLRFLCTNLLSSECAAKTTDNVYWVLNGTLDGSQPVFASRHFWGNYNINFDARGNIFTVHSDRRIRVLCIDPDYPGACFQKPKGFYYPAVGVGVSSPSIDGTAVEQATFDQVRGVTADADGNIYAAEYGAHMLFVACFNTAVTSGACFGKTAGKIYHLMGNGTNSDGGFDVPAAGVGIAWPQTVLVNERRDVYLSNYQDKTRVRTICYDVTSAGFCQGKTIGNTYNFLGNTGATCTYSADGTDSAVAATCKNYGMNFDIYGNLVLASYHSQGRVYAVCSRTTAGSGVCAGKTSGASYRLAGAGALADGATGPALTTSMCRGRGAAADPNGNVYIEDWCHTTRVVCNDVASAGFCQGKTAGTMYRWYGSGATGSGMASGYQPNGAAPATVDGTGAMIFDASGLLYSSRNGSVTVHFVNP